MGHFKNAPPVTIATYLFLFICSTYILKNMAEWLQPLFIAVFLYYISRPLVSGLTHHGIPEWWAHAIVLGTMAFLIIGIGWGVGSNLSSFAQSFPEMQQKLRNLTIQTADYVSMGMPSLRKRILAIAHPYLQTAPSDAFLKSLVSASTDFLSGSVLVIFYLIFLVHEARTLPSQLTRAFGEEKALKAAAIAYQINGAIIHYLHIKFFASLITAFCALVFLWLFNMPALFLLCTLVFVMNFIPYVGSLLSFLLIAGIGLLYLPSFQSVLALFLLLVAIDTWVGNYWEPKVSGQKLNMSPLLLLTALCYWGWVWGVIGLILAVPIMVSVKYILENIPAMRPLGILMGYERRHASREKKATEEETRADEEGEKTANAG